MALLKGTLLRGSISPRAPLILTPIVLGGLSRLCWMACLVWGFGPKVPEKQPLSGLRGFWKFSVGLPVLGCQGRGLRDKVYDLLWSSAPSIFGCGDAQRLWAFKCLKRFVKREGLERPWPWSSSHLSV